jgi:hypothetical protein
LSSRKKCPKKYHIIDFFQGARLCSIRERGCIGPDRHRKVENIEEEEYHSFARGWLFSGRPAHDEMESTP